LDVVMRRIALLLVLCLLAGHVSAEAAPAKSKPAPACAKKKAKKKPAAKKKKATAKKKKSTAKKKSTPKRKQPAKKKKSTAKKKPAKKKPCKKKPKPVAKTPAAPDLTPRDYTKTAGLSEPKHTDIETIKHKLITADGTDIYLEITKPKGAKDLGVILEASPYHGTLYPRTGTRILPLPVGKDNQPVGLVGYFPKRGYAVVMMDVRGTGRSGGCLDHLGPNDARDLKAVIEWAASQSWSNGRVGMLGHSYVGSTPIMATRLNPKGLVTIVPSAALASMYDHQFQAGVPFNLQWAGPVIAYLQLALDRELPPGLDDPQGGATGDDFLGHPVGAVCGQQNNALLAGPGEFTGVEENWHRARDASKEVGSWGGTVFAIHGVHDEAARISNLYWLARRGGRTTDKLWIGQWDHGIGCCPNQRGAQWLYALHAWLDRQLLQRDVDTGPPVETFLNDATNDEASIAKRAEIVSAPSWPIPGTRTIDFAPAGGGALVPGGPSGAAGASSFVGDPLGFALGADATGSVAFSSSPVSEDVLLLGTPTLELVASTTNPRADLITNVYDVAANGETRRLTQFAINPLVREGIDHFAMAVPGAKYTLKPPGFTMAHHLRKGHKLMLRVQMSDPDKVPFGVIDPNISVFYGAGGTALHLPVVDGATFYRDDKPVSKSFAKP